MSKITREELIERLESMLLKDMEVLEDQHLEWEKDPSTIEVTPNQLKKIPLKLRRDYAFILRVSNYAYADIAECFGVVPERIRQLVFRAESDFYRPLNIYSEDMTDCVRDLRLGLGGVGVTMADKQFAICRIDRINKIVLKSKELSKLRKELP